MKTSHFRERKAEVNSPTPTSQKKLCFKLIDLAFLKHNVSIQLKRWLYKFKSREIIQSIRDKKLRIKIEIRSAFKVQTNIDGNSKKKWVWGSFSMSFELSNSFLMSFEPEFLVGTQTYYFLSTQVWVQISQFPNASWYIFISYCKLHIDHP